MTNIVILGIRNHIATALAYELIQSPKNNIFAVDNLKGIDLSNYYAILKNDNFNLIDVDYTAEFNFPSDIIINFSQILDKNEYLIDKSKYTLDMIKKSEKILQYAKLTGSKLFNIYQTSDYNKFYAELFLYFDYIKMQSELNFEFSKLNKNYIRNIFINEVYGKYCSKDYDFTSRVITKAFNNEDVILDNDEFIYYSYSGDIVKGIITLFNNYTDRFNIELTSLNLRSKSDIIKLIINFTKSQSKLLIKSQDIISPSFEPDVKYMNDNFDFRCLTSVLDGISQTVSYYKMMYFQ